MKYVMMSKRFNKTSYEDFGLMFINSKYIRNFEIWLLCAYFIGKSYSVTGWVNKCRYGRKIDK